MFNVTKCEYIVLSQIEESNSCRVSIETDSSVPLSIDLHKVQFKDNYIMSSKELKTRVCVIK